MAIPSFPDLEKIGKDTYEKVAASGLFKHDIPRVWTELTKREQAIVKGVAAHFHQQSAAVMHAPKPPMEYKSGE